MPNLFVCMPTALRRDSAANIFYSHPAAHDHCQPSAGAEDRPLLYFFSSSFKAIPKAKNVGAQ